MDIMVTQQAQIKITLPLALKESLENKAKIYGVSTAFYVKHLIINEVKAMGYPQSEQPKRISKKLPKKHDEVYKK